MSNCVKSLLLQVYPNLRQSSIQAMQVPYSYLDYKQDKYWNMIGY